MRATIPLLAFAIIMVADEDNCPHDCTNCERCPPGYRLDRRQKRCKECDDGYYNNMCDKSIFCDTCDSCKLGKYICYNKHICECQDGYVEDTSQGRCVVLSTTTTEPSTTTESSTTTTAPTTTPNCTSKDHCNCWNASSRSMPPVDAKNENSINSPCRNCTTETTTTEPPVSNDKWSWNSLAILLVSLLGVIIVLLIIVLFMCKCERKKKMKEDLENRTNDQQETALEPLNPARSGERE